MGRASGKRKRPHRHHFNDLGIYVFESRHGPDFSMDIVTRDFHQLYLVRDGQGFVETETSKVPIREHHLFYAPAHTAHRLVDERSDPLTVVVICFYDKVFGDCTAAVECLSLFRQNFPVVSPFRLAENYTRLQIRNRFKAMFVEQLQKKAGSRSVVLAQLIELLIFVTRTYVEGKESPSCDPDSEAFAGSLRFIEDNFFRPIKIEELAAIANMSYRSYTEEFKQRTGKTVKQYLTERRVEYAKSLMLETGDILFTSYEAGFNDLTNFYRVFKKVAGSTPKQFITKHNPKPQNIQTA